MNSTKMLRNIFCTLLLTSVLTACSGRDDAQSEPAAPLASTASDAVDAPVLDGAHDFVRRRPGAIVLDGVLIIHVHIVANLVERDRKVERALVPWVGRGVGRYLISSSQRDDDSLERIEPDQIAGHFQAAAGGTGADPQIRGAA